MNPMASTRQALGTVSISRMLRVVVLLAAFLVLSGCSRFLFFPQSQWVRTPDALGIDYENVELVAADGTRLNAWWLESFAEPEGTVVFFHGNAENISTHIGSVYWLPEANYQVLMLEYRGYGKSEGRPGVPEIFQDIRAALEWTFADPRTQDKPVFVLAQSLGAAMSSYTIANAPELNAQLSGVAFDASFTSYREITREVASRWWLTWPFQYPAAWTMPRDYDPVDYVEYISPTPVLIIHGRQDEIIPFRMGEEMFAAAEPPKNFLSFDGPHIQTFRDLQLRQTLLDFYKEAPARKAVSYTHLRAHET